MADASVGLAVTDLNLSKPALYARYSGLAASACATQMRGSFWMRPSSFIMRKPAPSALTLPRLPPGMMTQSGTSQSNCCTISIETVFCPSTRRLFMLFAR